MYKKIATLFVLLCAFGFVQAQYAPVPLTGFTEDVIANGIGDATSSTTNSASTADSNWALVSADFQATSASALPTRSLPANGLLTDPGFTYVQYQLANYSSANSLRVTAASPTGTLSFVTPRTASMLYIAFIGTNDPPSGFGYPPAMEVDINFTDGTIQSNTNVSVFPWFAVPNGNYAAAGIGRVGRGSTKVPLNQLYTSTTVPSIGRLNQAITPANYGKTIKSITVKFPISGTDANTVINVLAVSAKAVCAAPADQPGSLTWGAITLNSISGTFTAAPSSPLNYLVVRYPAGATATSPVIGTSYTAGQALGLGTVVATLVAPNTTFTAPGLTAGTTYDFYIYSSSSNSISTCGGPTYLLTAPLKVTKATTACTGALGTLSIGPGGNFSTLTDALTTINTYGVGISGPVVLELKNNYTSAGETFPITISDNGCYSSINNLTIRPAPSANGLIVSGANAGPTIDINGPSYVTIDGTPGGTIGSGAMSVTATGSYNTTNLNIVNTNASGVAIRIDANTYQTKIKYCDLQGQNSTGGAMPSTMSGVVYVGNVGINGNDNLLIDHCNIHATAKATPPSRGIYVNGVTNASSVVSAAFNDSGTISSNNIYDFFHPADTSAGVELVKGVNAWKITGNNFFQTGIQSYTGNGSQRVIWIAPRIATTSVGNGFTIAGNYIGGNAPLCSGTPYVQNGAFSTSLEGMRLEVAEVSIIQAILTTPSSVQGNVIQNISFATGTQGTALITSDAFYGISCQASGRVDIGTTSPNTIGSVTNNASIVIKGGNYIGVSGISINNNAAAGIGTSPAPTFNVGNNLIGGLTLTGPGTIAGVYVGPSLGAASAGGSNQVVSISNNTIGSPTLNNSIIASDNGSLASVGSGIIVSPDVVLSTLNITDNKIANITNNSVSSTGSYLYGIAASYSRASTSPVLNNVTGNVIHNLYSASTTNTSGAQSAIVGICANVKKAVTENVSNNIVDSLVAGANAGVNVVGLYFNGATTVTHTISRNFIHSLDATGGNTSAGIVGLYNDTGASNVTNNMIRLGIKPAGTAIITPVNINGILSASTAANNFYFNTVYIGGTGVTSATSNTYAFLRSAISGTYDIRNNIFVNSRSNSTTGGKHYAVGFTTINGGANINYNVYQATGTGGVLGNDGTTDVANYAAGWVTTDINSRALDPQFVNPNGNLSTIDLHIKTTIGTPVEAAGTAISAVTVDYDGDTRANLTPTDIGADAGNFLTPSVTISGNAALCVGGTLALTASSGLPSPAYTWAGPNSYSATGASISLTNVTALAAGTYTLTATSGSAAYTTTAVVTVNAYPVISSVTNNGTLCVGNQLHLAVTATGTGTLGYQWTGPNGFTSPLQNPTKNVVISDSGRYKITVTTGVCSVSDSTQLAIVAFPTVGSILYNGPLCQDDQLNLYVTAIGSLALTYQWIGPNSFTSAQQNPIKNNVAFVDSGKYIVTVTNGGLCSISDSINVTLKARPVITAITNNGPFCEGDTLNLSAVATTNAGQLTYQWSGPNGFSSLQPNVSKINTIALDSGVYTLEVTDGYCWAQDSTVVVVNSLPQPLVSYANNTLSTGVYTTYQWINNGAIIPGATNGTYTISANGKYRVLVTNAAGCTDTSIVYEVTDYVGISSVSAIVAQVYIYPNPSTDVVYIQSPLLLNAALTNMDGRMIQQVNGVHQLSLKGLAAGVYLLHIIDQDGNLVKIEKVVKESE